MGFKVFLDLVLFIEKGPKRGLNLIYLIRMGLEWAIIEENN